MTLSREEFNKQCVEFVRRCSKYSDTTWTISRTCGRVSQLVEMSKEELDRADCSTHELLLTKNEQRPAPHGNQVQWHEFSVIFSDSYRVPVMYFCVSNQAGCPIAVSHLSSMESHDLSKVINQVEHPLLFRPFYVIHPCRTENFMQIHHAQAKAGYLVSWLSVVGTLVDLRLDSRFGLRDDSEPAEDSSQ